MHPGSGIRVPGITLTLTSILNSQAQETEPSIAEYLPSAATAAPLLVPEHNPSPTDRSVATLGRHPLQGRRPRSSMVNQFL